MAAPFLSSPLQITSTSPILFTKVTPTNQIHFNQRTASTCTSNKLRLLRRSAAAGTAVTDQTEGGEEVLINPTSEEEKREEVVDYDWTEEWYPLYLTRDVPDDSPLGLTVFDRQIVLYRDGEGTLRCYEDRCPHRWARTTRFYSQKSHLFRFSYFLEYHHCLETAESAHVSSVRSGI